MITYHSTTDLVNESYTYFNSHTDSLRRVRAGGGTDETIFTDVEGSFLNTSRYETFNYITYEEHTTNATGGQHRITVTDYFASIRILNSVTSTSSYSSVDNGGVTNTFSNVNATTTPIALITVGLHTSTTSNSVRSYSATQIVATTVPIVSVSFNGTTPNTYIESVNTTTYQTAQSFTTAAFPGLFFTTTVAFTVSRYGDIPDRPSTISVIDFEDFIDKNEWGFYATTLSRTVRDFIDNLGLSTTRLFGSRAEEYICQYTGISDSSTSYNVTWEATSLTTYTSNATTTTTAVNSYTTINSYSFLPFPITSSVATTESVLTTTAVTFLNSYTTTRSSNFAAGTELDGIAAHLIRLTTTGFRLQDILSTEAGKLLLPFHSSIVSLSDASFAATIALNLSSSFVEDNAGWIQTARTFSTESVVLGDTFISKFSITAGVSQTISRYPHTYFFFNTSVGSKAAVLGDIHPIATQGFRNPGEFAHSDTFGSAVTVDISGSNLIPFPFFSSEQKSSVLGLVTFSDLTSVEDSDSVTWNVSFNGRSVYLTHNNPSNIFPTVVDGEALLVNTTTVSAIFGVAGQVVNSTSYQTSNTNATAPKAFGGFAYISDNQEIPRLSQLLYSLIRMNRSNFDSTGDTAIIFANTNTFNIPTSQIVAFEAATAAGAILNTNGGMGVVTVNKWAY